MDADDADVHEMFEQLEKYVANIFASSLSVLASLPCALAKSLTDLGLTTDTLKSAFANVLAANFSYPPVDSITIWRVSFGYFLKLVINFFIPLDEFSTCKNRLAGR